ncbi:MAG: hydrogenase maturation protease [Asgard group archaeon]|nr:hydrogenase maturation protease [Asgard group archaeon]
MRQKILGDKLLKKIDLTKKICVLGIGNFDRADDYAGIAVAKQLEQKSFPENITILNVPEAFTGVIKREQPDILIIIDAAWMDQPPGTIQVFTEDKIETVCMITPHNTPITMFTKYLHYYLQELIVYYIGIQPKSMRYQEPMSDPVKKSIENLVDFLVKKLKNKI